MTELIRLAKEIVDSYAERVNGFQSLSEYRAAILETVRELKEASGGVF